MGRVDRRGRVTIPKEMRERAGLKELVRMRLVRGKIVIEPLPERPIERAKFKVTSVDIPKIRGELTKLAEDLSSSG
ncbi:MAG: AbrB/MazE/SpoVT family DNA-binding domain-containing protein [Candidatus Korarchaeota archaeon]|nr:AbrB/MazE/SpoVT family DNA-binding domain-containing protein [Candidatus Korarchaeota archaeon]